MDADKVRPLWREALKRAQGRADATFLADVALLHEALMAGGVEVTPEDVAIAEKTLQGLFTPKLHEGLEWGPVAMPNIGTIGAQITMADIRRVLDAPW